MTALSRFASLLSLPVHQAEDALHSERAARHALSRRGFFGVSAAMAAGTAFGFASPAKRVEVLVRLFGDPTTTATTASRFGWIGERPSMGAIVAGCPMRDGYVRVYNVPSFSNLLPFGKVIGYIYS